MANKNLNVDIVYNNKNVKKFTQRTLAISKNNFEFLLKTNKKMNISAWPVKNIKIFSDQKNSKEELQNTESCLTIKVSRQNIM